MDSKLKEKIISYRREFHKYPELGWREIRTTARIAEILDKLGFENLKVGIEAVDTKAIIELVKLNEDEKREEMNRAISQGADKGWVEKTKGYPGVVAEFDSGIEGPVVAFRFDIDALPDLQPAIKGYRPFDENFISQNENIVHSCGHDGHVAIGLGLAEEIMNNKGKLKGKVRLLFQPAEEYYSGADSMIFKGYLDDVDYLFTMHIGLSHEGRPLPSHSIVGGCNDFLSCNQYDVYFEGVSAHPCGASQEGKNALLAACTAALNIHAIAPHEEGLLRVNVGEIHAGTSPNTIAPNALIKIEFRGENNNISKYAKDRVLAIIDGAAKMYDVKYRIVDYGEIPTAQSDKECIEIVKEAAKKVEWFEKIYDLGNVGGSDDATVMMQRVQQRGGKATYLGLGADVNAPLHNSQFDFDEEVLIAGVELCLNILKITSSS